MACRCQETQQNGYKFVFTAPDGTQKTYATEIQARAAVVRAKGGAVQAVPK